VIGLLANLASCSSTPASGVSSASLAGKTVVSTSVTGHTLAAGSTVTLTFEGPIPGGLRRLQHDERGLCSRQFRIALDRFAAQHTDRLCTCAGRTRPVWPAFCKRAQPRYSPESSCR